MFNKLLHSIELCSSSIFALCNKHYFYENDIVKKDSNFFRVYKVTDDGYILECESTLNRFSICKKEQKKYAKCC